MWKFVYFCQVEKNGQIEIRVSGKIGNVDINPDNFDIREIISILENVDDLLYNGDKKNRPLISYDIQEGSVRNIFKTFFIKNCIFKIFNVILYHKSPACLWFKHTLQGLFFYEIH